MPAVINGSTSGHPLLDGEAWNALVNGKRIWPVLTKSKAASLTDRWIADPPRAWAPSSRATVAGTKITITHATAESGIVTVE